MTNMTVQCKPMVTMADSQKGSFKNRAKCVTEQWVNSTVATTGAMGTIYGAYLLAENPGKITNFINSAKSTVAPYAQKLAGSTVGQKAIGLINKAKATAVGQKAVSFINSTKASAKTLLKDMVKDAGAAGKEVAKFAKAHPAIAVGAGVLLALISLNSAFKAGQIDQKYTDKAKYENV